MPELPEVETIRRGLERKLVGRRVVAVDWRGAALRRASPVSLGNLRGRRFVTTRRVAKLLHLVLDDGATLVVHLGMTGKLLFDRPGAKERKHTHLVLDLDDGWQLRYVDPRRFGMIRLHAPGVVPDEALHYGVDALDEGLTVERLEALLRGSSAPLKGFLLDQTKIAGLGNIYVCEALWRAGLSPRRLARNTPRGKVGALRDAIRAVLVESLAAGGTSFNDYVDHIGRPGEFLVHLAVFQREGLACPRCGTTIRRITQVGRSTFYCPVCQS